MKRDLNYLAALEKSVAEKYGTEAIINPKSGWSPDKEQGYLQDVKKAQIKESKLEASQERIEIEGVLIAKKLINKNVERHCNYCDSYSFNREDDVYFTKFGTCHRCYVQYIVDREERWKNGWRPKMEHKNGT